MLFSWLLCCCGSVFSKSLKKVAFSFVMISAQDLLETGLLRVLAVLMVLISIESICFGRVIPSLNSLVAVVSSWLYFTLKFSNSNKLIVGTYGSCGDLATDPNFDKPLVLCSVKDESVSLASFPTGSKASKSEHLLSMFLFPSIVELQVVGSQTCLEWSLRMLLC